MKIAGATLNQTPLDWSNNTSNISRAIEKAKEDGVHILCLPEMCITGYGCEDMFLHPWVAEQALNEITKILPLTSNIAVTLGIPMWYDNHLYNTICFVYNGEILGFQAKQKLPNYGVHYEQRWFTPWTKGQQKIKIEGKEYQFGDYIYQIGEAVIGFEICEEAWNKDRPACRLVEQKVNLILNPSASHFALNKEKSRENLVVQSSEEFNCTYLYANQLGNEAGRIIYDGDIIIAQKGELLALGRRFSKKKFRLTSTEVNLDGRSQPNVKSRYLDQNQQFTKAVTLGLFDYLRKSRSKGFVLSLSGGADSSSLLVLVAEMVKSGIEELGIEKFLTRINHPELIGVANTANEVVKNILIAAYQGSKNSSKETFESAKELAESVGATFYHWTIDQPVESAIQVIENELKRKLDWALDDIALQNIQARSRSPIIWMLANISGSLLLTTSNRSEGSVGYTTMDGDTSGSLAPIAGIHKSFLVEWLKWAEKELNFPGLRFVNKLTPTAELRPKENVQTDEQDLMPYPVLQQIEGLFIREQCSPKAVFEELKKDLDDATAASYVIKFFKLWTRNQWKRERIAPSFHLDDYNVDPRSWFRFPILSGGFENELAELENLSKMN